MFAASGSFLLAAATGLFIDRVRSLRSSLLGAWIVPLTPPDRRATVLSTMEQADSISQVTIGPGMGVIGKLAGIPAALVDQRGTARAVRARRAPGASKRGAAHEPSRPAKIGG